ncbi:MAG: lysophospholipid acyltransferase family protein [Acidobacteriota bacterium]|nr:MAG: lysophospholipid acyltransferase family protein [Acidobacteriota bacterium]
MRRTLEWLAVCLLGFVVRRLGDGAAACIGRWIGRAAFRLLRRRRRVALRNLEAAYPGAPSGLAPDASAGLSPDERRALARRTFEHFACVVVEILRFPLLDKESCVSRVEFAGLEHMRAALAEGKGAIFCAGHFGNWELAALALGYAGFPMTMLTRPLDNPRLERLLACYRAASGNRLLHKHASLRHLMRDLRDGQAVTVVMDQHFGDANAVVVNFMGRPAATTPAVALLSLKTGAPVVMVFPIALGGGRYRVLCEPGPPAALTGDRAHDEAALTVAMTRRIEHYVRKHPEQWLWMHERWRVPARPSLGKSAAPEKEAEAPDKPSEAAGVVRG